MLETQISLTLERSLLKSRKPQDLHHTSAQVVLRRAGLVDNPSELFARLTGIGKRAPVHVIAAECRWTLGVLFARDWVKASRCTPTILRRGVDAPLRRGLMAPYLLLLIERSPSLDDPFVLAEQSMLRPSNSRHELSLGVR